MAKRTCSIDGCDGWHEARGWCAKHYSRWRNHGDPSLDGRTKGLTLTDRFWSKVDRRGPDECWPWTGYIRTDGYGKCTDKTGRGQTGAHRRALELKLGRPIKAGMLAMHSCDNPPCCNPAHLSEGTNAQNLADMAARGRSLAGERNPNARLTSEDAEFIRASPLTGVALAERFGVDRRHIYRIRRGVYWKNGGTPTTVGNNDHDERQP